MSFEINIDDTWYNELLYIFNKEYFKRLILRINDEYDKIMDFLNRVDENMLDINHKLIVSDIETEEDILKVIKSFYKNKKILIKKQIK